MSLHEFNSASITVLYNKFSSFFDLSIYFMPSIKSLLTKHNLILYANVYSIWYGIQSYQLMEEQ